MCVWNIWRDVKLLPWLTELLFLIRFFAITMNQFWVFYQAFIQSPFQSQGAWRLISSHANEAMEINWMEVWTQTSVPAVSLLCAFKSQLGDTSYCVFCCCLTALSSANQNSSTWGFSLLIIQWLLSGLIGVFLHVRCIPHQNSQRCFWASVWFMLDSSRWHEPFGESFSKLRLDTSKWPLNWHFWISNSSK